MRQGLRFFSRALSRAAVSGRVQRPTWSQAPLQSSMPCPHQSCVLSTRSYTTNDSASPTIQTLDQFKSLTTLSLNTPIIVYATDSMDDSVDKELVSAVHATTGAIQLARLDATSPELAPLQSQLHISSLPSTLVLFGGRLMDAYPGVPKGAGLQQYIAQILRLADDVVAHRATHQGSNSSGAAPAELLSRAYAALSDPGSDVEATALPLFQKVLEEGSPASDVEIARAYAGAARCAMLTGDIGGAEALVGAAQATLEEGKWPPEVAQAAAALDIFREARDRGAAAWLNNEGAAPAGIEEDGTAKVCGFCLPRWYIDQSIEGVSVASFVVC